MRRRDAVWWTLFAASALVWLVILAAAHSGRTPPDLLYAGMATAGLALSATHHLLNIQNTRRTAAPGAPPTPEPPP